MKNNELLVLILTHGRPDNVITIQTLRRYGYKGPIHLVVDNEDKTLNRYIDNFGKDHVHIFDKKEYADQIDEANNFDERRTITHARNASFDIAKKLGYIYFMQLDDDYGAFQFRINNKKQYPKGQVIIGSQINSVFEALLNFYKKIPALSIAMSQGGDWIGGGGSSMSQYNLKRKCMNSFICSVNRPFRFVGAMNEDVNTYTTLGSRGKLFFTMPIVSLNQMQTQSQAGGITDMYLKFGTLAKSFTTVMMMPSCVKINMMGNKHKRLHHKIKWQYCVPKILQQTTKK